jgi:hypothetical protein
MKKKNLILYITSVSGLLFWFISAFPFENRNESYSWIAHLQSFTFIESITEKLPSIVTFRPLSQGIVWLLYNAAGGEIYLVQVFNFLVLMISFFLLLKTFGEKFLTSLFLMAAGFIFISVFYYLFHVHGVFYSPMILFYAGLLYYYKKYPAGNLFLIISFSAAIIFSAIHTYSIIIYIAFLAGILVEKKFRTGAVFYIVLFLTLLTALILIDKSGSTPGLTFISAYNNLRNSLYSAEVSGKLSPVIILLLAAQNFNLKNRQMIVSLILLTAAGILFMLSSLPVLFLLIIYAGIKLFRKNEWTMLMLLCALVVFPAIVETGAPTKSALLIPLLFIVSGSIDSEEFIKDRLRPFIAAVSPILILFALLTRLNVQVPVLTSVTRPVIAEREKTLQMDEIMEWYLNSEYRGCSLSFEVEQVPLNVKTLNIDRNALPPTADQYIAEYISSKTIINPKCRLVISFGDMEIPNGKILFSSTYKYSGTSRVYQL